MMNAHERIELEERLRAWGPRVDEFVAEMMAAGIKPAEVAASFLAAYVRAAYPLRTKELREARKIDTVEPSAAAASTLESGAADKTKKPTAGP